MPRTYHIDIDSYIGYPISKGYVKSKLQPMKGKPCAVRINSYGGDVQTALDIRQQFIDHGQVTAYIIGMTASAATILAMGARKVVMSRYALMLVHPCSAAVTNWGYYNKEELAKAIEKLRKAQTDLKTLDSVVASIYAAKVGDSNVGKMEALMHEARWIGAEEALRLGLIDEIDPDEEQPDPAKEPMTDAQREHIVACGLPVPTFGMAAGSMAAESTEAASTEGTAAATITTTATATEQQMRKTIGEAVRDFFETIFARAAKPSCAAKPAEAKPQGAAAATTDDKPHNTNTPTMNTQTLTPATLCAKLGVAHITATDGKVTFTTEQIDALEKVIKALDDDKNEAEAKLNATDGDTTGSAKPSTEPDEGTALPGAEACDFYRKYGSLI
ncbi:Clp protease ClpP [Prevotellamassilia timonensis]|uniref:Clp protease ClpP n=1 Tax=Prevotellamassilia timonensis TaxID=1852370 RepID=UPI0030792DD3